LARNYARLVETVSKCKVHYTYFDLNDQTSIDITIFPANIESEMITNGIGGLEMLGKGKPTKVKSLNNKPPMLQQRGECEKPSSKS